MYILYFANLGVNFSILDAWHWNFIFDSSFFEHSRVLRRFAHELFPFRLKLARFHRFKCWSRIRSALGTSKKPRENVHRKLIVWQWGFKEQIRPVLNTPISHRKSLDFLSSPRSRHERFRPCATLKADNVFWLFKLDTKLVAVRFTFVIWWHFCAWSEWRPIHAFPCILVQIKRLEAENFFHIGVTRRPVESSFVWIGLFRMVQVPMGCRSHHHLSSNYKIVLY